MRSTELLEPQIEKWLPITECSSLYSQSFWLEGRIDHRDMLADDLTVGWLIYISMYWVNFLYIIEHNTFVHSIKFYWQLLLLNLMTNKGMQVIFVSKMLSF